MVIDDNGECVAIANLIGTDGCSIVGWGYQWTTGPHLVIWEVHGHQPDLTAEQKLKIDFDALKRIGRDEGR